MPKLFKLAVEVEEIALGSVMRQLHKMPGVAKVGMHLDELPKKPPIGRAPVINGRGHRAQMPRKAHSRGEPSGEDVILKIMLERGEPLGHSAFTAAFIEDGRSPKSPSPILHALHKRGFLRYLGSGKGYALTKKGRVRAQKNQQGAA